MSKNKEPKNIYPNLVSNQNQTARTNIIWVCDMTEFELAEGKKLNVFILIDVHVNAMLGFLVSKNKIKCSEIVKVLKRVIANRFTTEPKNKVLLHSDRGTQFTSDYYNDFTIDFKDFITPSMSRRATPTDNPVSERYMRTFKEHTINDKNLQDYIFSELSSGKKIKSYRTIIRKYLKSVDSKPNKKSFNKAPHEHDSDVSIAAMLMVDPKHTKAFSPNIMKDGRLDEIKEYKSENKRVVDALELIAARNAEVVNETPFDNHEANLQLKLVKQSVKEIHLALKSNPKLVKDQVEELLDPIQETLDEQFDEVKQRLDQLLPKERRKKEILPLRDPLKLDLFPLFMANAGQSFKYQKDLKRAQLRVTYTILYHVGLRINEIRNLNEEDIQKAIKSAQFSIIQSKTQKASIHVLSRKGVNDLKNCHLELEIVFKKYRYKYLLGKNKSVTAKSLIRTVNKDLKHTCEIQDIPFNIKSHSFRINMITNLLKVTTVQHTAEIIGHSDVRSTMMYNRYSLDKNEIQNILEKIQSENK